MPTGTKVNPEDIKLVTIPRKAILTKQLSTNSAEIVNKYVMTQVFKNSFVYTPQLNGEEGIDPFTRLDLSRLRKITLPISYSTGFAGEIKRGDRVDLMFVGEGKIKSGGESSDSFTYSKIFMQDVIVYNVATENGFKFANHSKYTQDEIASGVSNSGQSISVDAKGSGELGILILAVTPEQAEEIATRQMSGEIQLLSRFSESETYETLGFVLGDYGKIFSGNANAETSKVMLEQKDPQKAVSVPTDNNNNNSDMQEDSSQRKIRDEDD